VYELVILTVFPALVIFAACHDLVSYRIPNWISLALIGSFLALAPFAGLSLQDFGGHVLGAVMVLAVTFTLFALRYIGGGDAKLLPAISLWMGLSVLVEYLLLATLAGGLFGLMLIAFRRLPMPAALAREGWLMALHHPQGPIPYGIPLSAAAVYLYPHTIWVQSLAR
jgi:prepilin peptidase CpaA